MLAIQIMFIDGLQTDDDDFPMMVPFYHMFSLS